MQECPRQLLVKREAGEELGEVVEADEAATDRALPLEEAEEERLDQWPDEEDGVEQELRMGVGWQDPAVIAETGLCVWESGPRPVLQFKRNARMLAGRMALWWTGSPHDTPALIDHRRDYDAIETAGRLARDAVIKEDFEMLAEAVSQSYAAQLDEGMQPLPDQADALGYKYCGSGWGGYAVYLFKTSQQRDVFAKSPGALVAEPYTRHAGPTRKRSTGELANRTRAAPSANAAAQGAQLPSS